MSEVKLANIRKFRMRLVLIVLPTLLGVFGWLNVLKIREFFYINEEFVLTVSGVLIATGIGAFLLFYLRGGINVPLVDSLAAPMQPNESENEYFFEEYSKELKALKSKVSLLAKSQVSIKEGQIEDVVNSLKASITDNLDQHIEESYSTNIVASRHVNVASEIYINATKRLSQEIDKLSRRASLNLVIGVLTTASAVALLVYTVLGTEQVFTDITGLLSYYIPRIAIVILVETFSYFFLRLYKGNLEEIKYYQSEITDINKNQVAHNIAVYSDKIELKKAFMTYSIASAIHVIEQNSTDIVEQTGKIASVAEHLSKTVGSLAKKEK